MENYSTTKNDEFMKFLGKWMEIEKCRPDQGNPFTKEYTWYTLTDKWMLAQKLKINKLEFPQHRKLQKKENLSEDVLVPLRKRTKYSQEQ